MLRIGIFLLESAFSGLALWLGLYLITRDERGEDPPGRDWWARPAPWIGLSLLSGACYFLGAATQAITDDPAALGRWLRLTWWAIPLPSVTLLRGILLLTAPAEPVSRARGLGARAAVLLVAGAIVVGVAGVATDRFFAFGSVQPVAAPPHYLEITSRTPFDWEALAIVGVQLATMALAVRHHATLRGVARRQFRWVVVAMVLEFAGTALDLISVALNLGVSREVGNTLLAAGIALLGYSVAQHGAFFRQQVIVRDFFRALAGAAVASVAFVLAFGIVHALAGVPLAPASLALLPWLAIATLTLYPWAAARLDAAFLPAAAARVRHTLTQAVDDLAVAGDQGQALRRIEQAVPAAVAATLQDLELRKLKERIVADVNQLFRGTNYTRDDSDRYIALNTGLLDLAVIEQAATALMVGEGISPDIDRDHYRLKAFQRTIAALVADMATEADAAATSSGDPDGVRHRRQQARATILQQQFLQDVPRAAVQQLIERRYYVGGGGGYGRLLLTAKQDLATQLYLAERRARECQVAIWDNRDVAGG